MGQIRWFYISFLVIFFLDQGIKILILEWCIGEAGCVIWDSHALSLILVFNKGVAFSLLSFLDGALKYFQILLLCGVLLWLFKYGKDFFQKNAIALGFILAGGSSNLLDRFVNGGVVDYIYWHLYFEFAVFNFADVMIDVGVGLIILGIFYDKRRANSSPKK